MQITKELIDQKLAAYVAQVRESFGDIYADPLAAKITQEMAVFAENQEHFGLPGLEHDRTLNFRACIEFLHIHRLADMWNEIPGSRQAGGTSVATRYLVEDATRYIHHRIDVTGLGQYTELLVEISEFELIAALLYSGVELRHRKRKAHYRNGQAGIETFAVLPRARFNACREMHRRQGAWVDPQHRAWAGSALTDK